LAADMRAHEEAKHLEVLVSDWWVQ